MDNQWHNAIVRNSYVKVFVDKQKLYEMALLRRMGWTFTALAILYNCDRTSVRDQCRKYCIFPLGEEVFNPERIVTRILVKENPVSKTAWTIIDGEKVCLGRSYKDYFK